MPTVLQSGTRGRSSEADRPGDPEFTGGRCPSNKLTKQTVLYSNLQPDRPLSTAIHTSSGLKYAFCLLIHTVFQHDPPRPIHLPLPLGLVQRTSTFSYTQYFFRSTHPPSSSLQTHHATQLLRPLLSSTPSYLVPPLSSKPTLSTNCHFPVYKHSPYRLPYSSQYRFQHPLLYTHSILALPGPLVTDFHTNTYVIHLHMQPEFNASASSNTSTHHQVPLPNANTSSTSLYSLSVPV